MGEPPGRDWNLRNSRTNLLMNLTSLALNAGSGPGGDISRETSPYKGPRDQPPGRTNARVREVVKSIKNPPAELNWNQRTRRSCGEVTEDRRGPGGDGDHTDNVSGQEGCMVESVENL